MEEEYIGESLHIAQNEEGFVLTLGKDTDKPTVVKISVLTAYRLKFYLERTLL